jgi:hypothetical protein
MSDEQPNLPLADRYQGAQASFHAPALPDINAETYPFDTVQQLLDQAAFLNMFSVPDPGRAQVVFRDPGHSGGAVGLRISEVLHRFEISMRPPALDTGLRALNRIGEPIGRFAHRWMLIPDDFHALPDLEPPATPFNASHPQRFAMLDGICTFNGGRDGFRGFGTGTTYPVLVNGQRQLLAAAVGSILEGFGKFKSHEGTYTYSGRLSEKQGFSGNLLCRIIDPEGDIRTRDSLPTPETYPDPEPGITYIIFRGQKKDKHQETAYNIGPDGDVRGLNVAQELKIVHIDSAARSRTGLHSTMSAGPVIGGMTAKILFNLLHPGAPGTSRSPIPFQSYNEYTFLDRDGRSVGTIVADGGEGRTFNMKLAAAPGQAALRFGGFGLIMKGTGLFAGITGLMTDNSVVGVAPHALSTLYVLRIDDPGGKYRDVFSTTHATRRQTETQSTRLGRR